MKNNKAVGSFLELCLHCTAHHCSCMVFQTEVLLKSATFRLALYEHRGTRVNPVPMCCAAKVKERDSVQARDYSLQ